MSWLLLVHVFSIFNSFLFSVILRLFFPLSLFILKEKKYRFFPTCVTETKCLFPHFPTLVLYLGLFFPHRITIRYTSSIFSHIYINIPINTTKHTFFPSYYYYFLIAHKDNNTKKLFHIIYFIISFLFYLNTQCPT